MLLPEWCVGFGDVCGVSRRVGSVLCRTCVLRRDLSHSPARIPGVNTPGYRYVTPSGVNVDGIGTVVTEFVKVSVGRPNGLPAINPTP